jgi:zinc protease
VTYTPNTARGFLSRRSGWSLAVLSALTFTTSSISAQMPRLPYEKFTLPNGLEVILHVDRSVPIVAVNTWYKVGSGDEKVGRTGFAHLFEHVMFMGSQHVPVGKFDEWLEAAGASNNGTTDFDRTMYYETGPSNALPLMLWLDADRMGWLLPTMDLAKLDVQRDIVKNERRQSYDNAPYGRAFETLLATMYPKEHPYSWSTIGSMADLSAASVDDVSEFFRKYYAPNNAAIAIAGDFNVDSAKAWVTKYFGSIPRNTDAPVRPTVPRVALTRDTVVVMEDQVQLPRVYEMFPGVRVFHEDEPALDALTEIVAGGKSSRLYRTLVYEKQIAQDVSLGNNAGRLDGQIIFVATAKPGQHPKDLVAAFHSTVEQIANEGITERELTQVKNGVRAELLDRMSSVLGKADQLNMYNYYTGTPDYLTQDLARYEKLTTADVQRVAKQYLAGKNKVVLTVVPQGKKELAVTGGAR